MPLPRKIYVCSCGQVLVQEKSNLLSLQRSQTELWSNLTLVMPFRSGTFMMLVGYKVFLYIWLVAEHSADPPAVGSIASLAIIKPDYLYHCYGWIFWEIYRQKHDRRVVFEKFSDAEPAMTFKDIPDEELVGSLSF